MRWRRRLLAGTTFAALVLGSAAAAPAVAVTTAPASDTATTAVASTAKSTKPRIEMKSTVTPTPSLTVTLKAKLVAPKDVSYRLGTPIVKLVAKNAGVKKPVQPLFKTPNWVITPAHSRSIYFMDLYDHSTPGRYQVTVPITAQAPAPVKTTNAKVIVTVKASLKSSKARSGFGGKVNASGSATLEVHAPNYQRGAKLTAYFKAKGSKTYKKVGTGTLTKTVDALSTGKVSVKA